MIPVNKEIFDKYEKIIEDIKKQNEVISIQNEELLKDSKTQYEKEVKKIKTKNVKIQKKHNEFLEQTKVSLIHCQEDLIALKKLEKNFDSIKDTKLIKVYCAIDVQLTNVCLIPNEFKEYADFVIESIEDFENFKKYFDDSWYLVKVLNEDKEILVQKINRKYGDYSILDIEFLEKRIKIHDISKVNLTSELEYIIKQFEQLLKEPAELEKIPEQKSVKLIEYIAIPSMETPEYFGIADTGTDTINFIRNAWT